MALFVLGLLGFSRAETSRYTKYELVITFDGRAPRIIATSRLMLHDDVDIEEYRRNKASVPPNAKLVDARIVVKPQVGKAKTYGTKDAVIISDLDGSSLISDLRAYLWDLDKAGPGSVIDYRYELNLDVSQGSDFQSAVDRIPIDTVVFKLIFPSKKWRLKYSLDNSEPRFVDSCDQAVFEWRDVPALGDPRFDGTPVDYLPGLWYTFEPKSDGRGIADWADVAGWAARRMEREKPFSDPNAMLTIANTPEEIVNAINAKCRYVAIELDEGKYTPPSPEDVWRNGYGDCKGLACLCVNWLRLAGFNSWPVLVEADTALAGRPDFPSPYVFNHVIAAWSNPDGDTCFQDLTAEYCPPGYIPISLYGSLALPVAATARPFRLGAFPKTPDSMAIEIIGTVSRDGVLSGHLSLRIRGRDAFLRKWLGNWTNSIDWQKDAKLFLERLAPRVAFRNIQSDTIDWDGIVLSADLALRQFSYERDGVVAYRPWVFEFLREKLEPDSARVWPMALRRNYCYDLRYRIRTDRPLPQATGDTIFKSYAEELSFELTNGSHDDSLLLDLKLTLPPKMLPADSIGQYLSHWEEFNRALESTASLGAQ